jgi:hypothetical protein
MQLSNLMRIPNRNRNETKLEKNFLILKVLELGEIFEPNRIPSTH